MFRPTLYKCMALVLIFAVAMTALFVYPTNVHSQSPVSQKIESDDAQVTRAGNWSSQSTATASGGSYLYNAANQADAVLALAFSGTYLEVVYVSGPSLGTLAIEVDGTVLRTVITTTSDVAYLQSAKITYLTDENHTVKVYAQEGGVIAVDAFVVMTAGAPVEATPEGETSGVTNVASDPDASPRPRVAPVGHLVINEVDADGPEAVEIFNPTTAAVNMTSWNLRFYDGTGNLDINYIFPVFALYPGAYVVVTEGVGTNTATNLYAGTTTDMEMQLPGAVALLNNLGGGIDFVRWNNSGVVPPAPTTFVGAGLTIPNYDASRTIARASTSDDDDDGGDWSLDCPTLGGPNHRCLELNEIYLGIGDYVEILNASSDTLPLGDYTLRTWLADGSGYIDFDIPAVNIPSGGLVRIQDMDVAFTPSSTLIMTNFNINWTGDSGAAAALLLGATGVDFVSYRNATWVTPPAGTSFSGTAIPNYNLDASIARNRGGIDTNQATDWCHQNPSPNLPNASCLVINEVFTGTTDWVELYNPSLAPIALTNYDVISYELGGFDISYNFVPFTLNPGAYVQVVEGAGTNTATTVYTGTNFAWDDVADGAAYLVTDAGTGVDAVRFGLETSNPSGDAAFVMPNAVNVNAANNRAIARNSSSSDSDQGSDFCDQPATPGTRNYGCNSRLALFLSANQFISLIDSTANPPAPNDYYSYVAGAPAGASGGQWVMGDWDGNGSKTPGVYQTTGAFAGVFFTTNDFGPTARWTTTWFGLFAGVAGNSPVAGRFGAGANDCLGVMDSQNFPPYGTAFALYFTCNTAGGNPAKTVQWNSILLPDSGGFTGTFQFSAGDFDGNGIDSIACRRGPYVTWTNTNPTVVNGTFPNAQYIGAPVAGTSLFAVGDWDNNALSSFALFYPATGTLYFRNDLIFNSGVYGTEAVGLPLGPVVTVATWKGY